MQRALWGCGVGWLLLLGCSNSSPPVESEPSDLNAAREYMITHDLQGRGIRDPAVLDAMRTVPRQEFVPQDLVGQAYGDHPLPIGAGQTISQPYIVALMTELARPTPESVVLEIGTGSGYQAAVLAEIVRHVYTIEIIERLADTARDRLQRLGYTNITVKAGDGYVGWEEHAPFDAILVTAAPEQVPQPLLDQLKTGGRLVIPIGAVDAGQSLTVFEKKADGKIIPHDILPVRFVPLTGEHTKH